MEVLRFTTAGSVDDGKSTLIGRLLYDSQSIYKDQIEKVEGMSHAKGRGYTDFSLFTDGLREEVEQGVTIDVAHLYFSTKRRKFIIADSPGHFEYTRNMFTAASTAHLSLILIDATKGLVEQTLRHCSISSLLGISQLIVCVNKMDLVDYGQKVFNDIKSDFAELIQKLEIKKIQFIPLSALQGDNVVHPSKNMPWYEGQTLLHYLEQVDVPNDLNKSARFPIQNVLDISNGASTTTKLLTGRLASGELLVGDQVTILPSGEASQIKALNRLDKSIESVTADMSISIALDIDLQVNRGDVLVPSNDLPVVVEEIDVVLCWLRPEPPQLKREYVIMHCHQLIEGTIEEVHYVLDNNTLETNTQASSFAMNDIAKVSLKLSSPIVKEAYKVNRTMGSMILIDSSTNETLAAAIIE